MTETTQEAQQALTDLSPLHGQYECDGEADKIRKALDRLAHIERQILYRDESMPVWAKEWGKDYLGCYFTMACGRGTSVTTAPDYRPNEDECTLAIIEPPEGE